MLPTPATLPRTETHTRVCSLSKFFPGKGAKKKKKKKSPGWKKYLWYVIKYLPYEWNLCPNSTVFLYLDFLSILRKDLSALKALSLGCPSGSVGWLSVRLQVMISLLVGSSPASGSVLTAPTEPGSCFGFCVSLCLCPSPTCSTSLKNK